MRHDDGNSAMQLGMIGLGRMGANMVRRLMRRPRVRRLRPSPKAVRGPGRGEGRRRLVAEDFVTKLDDAARGLADGAGGRGRRDHRRPRCRCSSRATSSSTAATPTTSTTSAAPSELAREGHPLRRRRHQRRRLGPGARLLPDDRRRGRGRAAPRSDLRDARPGHRRHRRARPAARRRRRHGRARLSALRAERRRATSSRWSTTASSTG